MLIEANRKRKQSACRKDMKYECIPHRRKQNRRKVGRNSHNRNKTLPKSRSPN